MTITPVSARTFLDELHSMVADAVENGSGLTRSDFKKTFIEIVEKIAATPLVGTREDLISLRRLVVRDAIQLKVPREFRKSVRRAVMHIIEENRKITAEMNSGHEESTDLDTELPRAATVGGAVSPRVVILPRNIAECMCGGHG